MRAGSVEGVISGRPWPGLVDADAGCLVANWGGSGTSIKEGASGRQGTEKLGQCIVELGISST